MTWKPRRSLSAALAHSARSEVRQRGQAYYRQGRVDIQEGGPDLVDAQVLGSRRYSVRLELRDANIYGRCTCPYYEDRGLCKHIWATILAAEAEGYLQDALAAGAGVQEADDYDDWLAEFDAKVRDLGLGFPDEQDEDRWSRPRRRSSPASWKRILSQVNPPAEPAGWGSRGAAQWPAGQQLLYVLDCEETAATNALRLDVLARRPKKNGDLGKPQPFRVHRIGELDLIPEPLDRQILAVLLGAGSATPFGDYFYGSASFRLSQPLLDTLLPMLCRTQRFHLRRQRDEEPLFDAPCRIDDGPSWEMCLHVARDGGKPEYVVRGLLRRGQEEVSLAEPALLLAGGWVFSGGCAARLHDPGTFGWIVALGDCGELRVPLNEADEFLTELVRAPAWPRLDLPDELRFEEVVLRPRPLLTVRRARFPSTGDKLSGELAFEYDGMRVSPDAAGDGVFQADRRRLVRRDREAEAGARRRLMDVGFKADPHRRGEDPILHARLLPKAVTQLLAEGWRIEIEGKPFRRARAFSMEVRSGIDWFELHGTVDFGGAAVPMPELLAAAKKGEDTVVLEDGSLGMLPEEWLKKWGLLAGMGALRDDHVRFERGQAALLDALLAAAPEVRCDEVFSRAREELRRFESVEQADPPPSFTGSLRGYQRDGLGWLHFLRRFGLGGCLADDMGLGKTVQVLALLEARRQLRAGGNLPDAEKPAPSLVVVPRSLLFNWKQEAARFTPELLVLEHTGMARQRGDVDFGGHDLVLTTYGTLRRDVTFLKEVPFDYVILDEAQAIKNASTASAKAARLLHGRHRLALSGTPVENHLGELWSLVEFLNPGMFGSASVFQSGLGRLGEMDEATRALLARALRPVILRRTKAQVARDLPERTEQTVYCELQGQQRQHYEEIRDHYRQTLLARVESQGIAKSKMHVLEALLRLRQAACHPGLIDKARTAESSAKLEALLPQLAEVTEEGHKALVFSQFTSLLAIVRDRLDAEGIPYAYLDGRTRDRAARVERFQTEPGCKLFLISLKAGGLGLNLTAAEYVFLLDPWWNPAVEAQAIDRTHRIGQTRPVFAYRLIARDTVEEKVLELQRTKRELADAIIGADNSLVRNLTREDLALLLG